MSLHLGGVLDGLVAKNTHEIADFYCTMEEESWHMSAALGYEGHDTDL